ncbi:hypothetical protein MMPV_007871 [Pyropia vietnamensis]
MSPPVRASVSALRRAVSLTGGGASAAHPSPSPSRAGGGPTALAAQAGPPGLALTAVPASVSGGVGVGVDISVGMGFAGGGCGGARVGGVGGGGGGGGSGSGGGGGGRPRRRRASASARGTGRVAGDAPFGRGGVPLPPHVLAAQAAALQARRRRLRTDPPAPAWQVLATAGATAAAAAAAPPSSSSVLAMAGPPGTSHRRGRAGGGGGGGHPRGGARPAGSTAAGRPWAPPSAGGGSNRSDPATIRCGVLDTVPPARAFPTSADVDVLRRFCEAWRVPPFGAHSWLLVRAVTQHGFSHPYERAAGMPTKSWSNEALSFVGDRVLNLALSAQLQAGVAPAAAKGARVNSSSGGDGAGDDGDGVGGGGGRHWGGPTHAGADASLLFTPPGGSPINAQQLLNRSTSNAECARRGHALGLHLLLRSKSNGSERALADAYEAVVGAVFLVHGFDAARALVAGATEPWAEGGRPATTGCVVSSTGSGGGIGGSGGDTPASPAVPSLHGHSPAAYDLESVPESLRAELAAWAPAAAPVRLRPCGRRHIHGQLEVPPPPRAEVARLTAAADATPPTSPFAWARAPSATATAGDAGGGPGEQPSTFVSGGGVAAAIRSGGYVVDFTQVACYDASGPPVRGAGGDAGWGGRAGGINGLDGDAYGGDAGVGDSFSDGSRRVFIVAADVAAVEAPHVRARLAEAAGRNWRVGVDAAAALALRGLRGECDAAAVVVGGDDRAAATSGEATNGGSAACEGDEQPPAGPDTVLKPADHAAAVAALISAAPIPPDALRTPAQPRRTLQALERVGFLPPLEWHTKTERAPTGACPLSPTPPASRDVPTPADDSTAKLPLWAVTVRVGPLTGRGVSVMGWDAAADAAAAAALRSLRATRAAELAAYDAGATAAAAAAARLRPATSAALSTPVEPLHRASGGGVDAASPPSGSSSAAASSSADTASSSLQILAAREFPCGLCLHSFAPPPLTVADVIDKATLTAGARLPAPTALAVADAAAAVAAADRLWRDLCAQVGDRTGKLWAARRVSGLGGVASPAVARAAGAVVGVSPATAVATTTAAGGVVGAATTGELTALYETEMTRCRVAERATVVGVRDTAVAGRVHWWRAVVGEYVRRHGVDAALALVDLVEVARSRQQRP